MYIDAHAHLLKAEYGNDLKNEINTVENSKIILVNNIGYDLSSSKEAISLSKEYEFLFATIGVHPYNANGFNAKTLEEIKKLAENKKALAIGEIGLDYFRNITDFSMQRKIFEAQLNLAKELSLPFMIHSRDAFKDTVNIIKKVNYFNGIFHSFDYGEEETKEVIEMGLYVSFSGMITFKKKEGLRKAAGYAPIEKVLLETDSPYLAPVPMRGKRNTPLFVKYVYEKFALLKEVDIETLSKRILQNFETLFKRSKIYLDTARR